jgi:hypothetical protein
MSTAPDIFAENGDVPIGLHDARLGDFLIALGSAMTIEDEAAIRDLVGRPQFTRAKLFFHETE